MDVENSRYQTLLFVCKNLSIFTILPRARYYSRAFQAELVGSREVGFGGNILLTNIGERDDGLFRDGSGRLQQRKEVG